MQNKYCQHLFLISRDSFQKLKITDCLEMGLGAEWRMGSGGEAIQTIVSEEK